MLPSRRPPLPLLSLQGELGSAARASGWKEASPIGRLLGTGEHRFLRMGLPKRLKGLSTQETLLMTSSLTVSSRKPGLLSGSYEVNYIAW